MVINHGYDIFNGKRWKGFFADGFKPYKKEKKEGKRKKKREKRKKEKKKRGKGGRRERIRPDTRHMMCLVRV